MHGLLKAGLLAAPALSAAFVVPPQDEHINESVEDIEVYEAHSSSLQFLLGVPSVEKPELDIDVDAKTTVHINPAAEFRVDVHPYEEACGFGAVTINDQELPQQERDGKTSGKGSISTPDDHIVVASWTFECIKEEDTPVAQRLSFDIELVDGSAVSEEVGFQVEFSQQGPEPVITGFKPWDRDITVVSIDESMPEYDEEFEHERPHGMEFEHEHKHPHGMDFEHDDEHKHEHHHDMEFDHEHEHHHDMEFEHEHEHPHGMDFEHDGPEHGHGHGHPDFEHAHPEQHEMMHEMHEIQCLKDQIHHLKHILHKKEKALARQSNFGGCHQDVTDCDNLKCVITSLYSKAKGAVGRVAGHGLGLFTEGPEFDHPPFDRPPFDEPPHGPPHGHPGEHGPGRHFNGSHPPFHGNKTHDHPPRPHSFCEMFGGPEGFGAFGHHGHKGPKGHKWGHGSGFDAESFKGPHGEHDKHRGEHHGKHEMEGEDFKADKHHGKGGKGKHHDADKFEESGRHHHQGGRPENKGHHEHDEMKPKHDKPHHKDGDHKPDFKQGLPTDDTVVDFADVPGDHPHPHGPPPHDGPKGEHHHPHPHDGPDGDFHPHGGPGGDFEPHGPHGGPGGPHPHGGPGGHKFPGGPNDGIMGTIRFVKFSVCAILFCAFAFALHRRLTASRRISREERQRLGAYRSETKKNALCSFFRRLRGNNDNDMPGDYEEKRTLLVTSAAPQEDVMASEIVQLQNAAGVVGDIVAAEEGRAATSPVAESLPVYRDQVAEVTTVEELPAYDIYDGPDNASVVTDGFCYTPGSSDYTPSGSDSGSVNNILGDTKN